MRVFQVSQLTHMTSKKDLKLKYLNLVSQTRNGYYQETTNNVYKIN